MSHGNPGERDARWAKARAALAQVDELIERHARLTAEAPDLGAAAHRASDRAFTALEQLTDRLREWTTDLDDWAAVHARQHADRQARGDALLQQLRSAWPAAPEALTAWVQTALNLPDLAVSETAAPEPSDPPPAPSEVSVKPALPDPPSVAPAIAAIGLGAIGLDSTPPAEEPEPEVFAVEPAEVDAAVDGALQAVDDLLIEPPDPQGVAAQFNFSLHDMEPVSIPTDEPPLFDFGDAPANDDLSTLQPDDLDEVIQATPEPEIEDVSMGSLGLMDTSALSTEQVRAQLQRIRAERAAAKEAAAEEAAAAAAADEVAEDPPEGPTASTEVAPEHRGLLASGETPALSSESLFSDASALLSDAPALLSDEPAAAGDAPEQAEESLPAVVEVESGPIAVLDVRELLGEPPERPSRIDAAVRAALSDAPAHEPAPAGAAASAEDWLEATPTSHPPRSALGAGESVEIDLNTDESVDDLDSTVALQAQDLSAAMDAVADADDWLDVSQSLPGGAPLTSNQSLEAIADDALAAADPWAELDISAHGEIKAGHVSTARAPRASLNINVGIEHAGNFFTARSDNISSAGMFVTCDQSLPVSSRVDLFFEMPDGQSVAVQAQISWQRKQGRPGYGLQFLGLRYDDRVVIDRFVSAQAAGL